MQGRPSFFLGGGGGIHVESYRRAALLKNVQQKYEKKQSKVLKISFKYAKDFCGFILQTLKICNNNYLSNLL